MGQTSGRVSRLELVAQVMFDSGPSSSLVQMIAIKRDTENVRLSCFAKTKVFVVALALWYGNKSHRHDFLGNFHSCPSQK
jgi:hypothetical protein